MFEAGEVKYVILRLLKEKPRHGYEIMKALEEHRDVIDDIFDRVRDALRGLAGGGLGELNQAFARLAGLAYRQAWRAGAEDAVVRKIVEILRRAADEIERGRFGSTV